MTFEAHLTHVPILLISALFLTVNWLVYKLCSNQVPFLSQFWHFDKSCLQTPLHFTPHCFFYFNILHLYHNGHMQSSTIFYITHPTSHKVRLLSLTAHGSSRTGPSKLIKGRLPFTFRLLLKVELFIGQVTPIIALIQLSFIHLFSE